jgi:hypothetical protein
MAVGANSAVPKRSGLDERDKGKAQATRSPARLGMCKYQRRCIAHELRDSIGQMRAGLTMNLF